MDEVWLNLVRMARDGGDISSLFPRGIRQLCDLPFTIYTAIHNALIFLKFEELEEDEQPPRKIWLDNEKMKAWWAEVKQRREEKYKPDGADYSKMTRNPMMDDLFIGAPRS